MDEVATGIFVGTEADASDESLLEAHGIDAVVSLTHSKPDTGDITRIDVPMIDGPQNSYQSFADAVQAVLTPRDDGQVRLNPLRCWVVSQSVSGRHSDNVPDSEHAQRVVQSSPGTTAGNRPPRRAGPPSCQSQ